MKKGINTADILDLAEVYMKVYNLSVGAFMDELVNGYHSSLELTDPEVDQIEFALIRKAIAENCDKTDMIDMLVDHAYEIKASADNEDYSLTDFMLGRVKARSVYEAIRDIIINS